MKSECVFCDIVWGKASATILRNTEGVLVIRPLNPVVKGHVLILPKKHVEDYTTDALVTAQVMQEASDWGYHLRTDSNLITSRGVDATQSVFHFHVHIVPRKRGDGLHLPWTGQVKAEELEVQTLPRWRPTYNLED